MDPLRIFLDEVQRSNLASGRLLGLLHILIGRKIYDRTGTMISSGVTWRAAAELLKSVRWDPATVAELGIDPAKLPTRDRVRYWFQVISSVQIASPQAILDADRLIAELEKAGFSVGHAPGHGLTQNIEK